MNPEISDADLRNAVRRLLERAVCTTGFLTVGSPEWWAAPAPAQLASVAVAGAEYVPADLPATADRTKAAAVAISEEWKRQREMVRRRKEAIGAALRRGEGERAFALTCHHGSNEWWQEVP
ncbi:MAG: hypothetical protein M3460_11200 [Actinomycetota bacterium]|nr:hypothetical protein [Actinomycetota bacterium]